MWNPLQKEHDNSYEQLGYVSAHTLRFFFFVSIVTPLGMNEMRVIIFVCVCVCVGLSRSAAAFSPSNSPLYNSRNTLLPEDGLPRVEASFGRINFTFQSISDAETYFNEEHYKSCMIAGVKLDMNGEIYVTIPRWKDNVPATLNKVINTGDGIVNGGKYVLQPYPSWGMNTVGDSNALQSVLGFEIDDKWRMWILDQGKVNGKPAIPNSIKLTVCNCTMYYIPSLLEVFLKTF
jgi:hypothetical protein